MVILFAALFSGCVGIGGPTSVSMVRQSESTLQLQAADRPFPAYGKLPVIVALFELQRLEIVRSYPALTLLSDTREWEVEIASQSRVRDVIKSIELARGWVFDPETRDFYEPPASHTLESPDEFGRATGERVGVSSRAMVAVSFMFKRASAGLTPDEISLGGDGTLFRASIPEGVPADWTSGSERGYFEGVSSPESDSGQVVQTTRQTVSAGIALNAVTARLPGGKFRIDGKLTVSSFTGQTLDRASINVPLQCDGDRGRWIRILTIAGGDIGIRAAFQGSQAIKASASGEALELLIRVD